jgi:hypothetical protein
MSANPNPILIKHYLKNLLTALQEKTSQPTKGQKQFVYGAQKPEGLREPGNIDISPGARPVVHNPDGTHSTELSFSRGTDKGEVLVPRVVNGKILSEDDAWKHYQDTGEHMGVFDTPDHANRYAELVHNRDLTEAPID